MLLHASQVNATDNILILNSYHRGKLLSDQTIDSIVAELHAKRPELCFLIEDMDTKRCSLEDVREPLLKLYAKKYRDVELRAVVTVDNNAFDFAIENRETLFPGAPIVFCGFNGFEHSVLDGLEGVTGVAEAIDLEATVKLALTLHPKTTHLAVVSDTTPTGGELLDEFREYARQLPQSLQIVELVDVTAQELRSQLKGLPPSSVVLRLAFFRDAAGQSFTVDEQVGLIAGAGLPVYDFWDEGGIGGGYVGGYVVTGRSQGKVVSEMLERLLAGESPEQIAVVDRSPNKPVFDKRELLRTGVNLDNLPSNAEVRNEPSVWQQYRQLLIGLGIAFTLISALAIFFAVLSVQRKRHAVALAHEEQKLRATLQSIGEGVVTANSKGEVEAFNAVAEKWTGLPIEKVQGRHVSEVFQLTDATAEAAVEMTSNDTFAPTASGILKTSSGDSLPIVRTAAPISLPDGKDAGTVIVFRDMTRENELQQELEQVRRLDALGQLAGGVAHDFNNMLGAVMCAAELLGSEIHDESLKEFPQLILDSAKDAAGLTRQLLSFARKQPVSKQNVHTREIIDETVAVLKRTIDPRIQIEVQGGTEDDVVYADRTLLKSGLLNLGINASHAMPSGGKLVLGTRTVELDADHCENSSFEVSPGRYLEVRVEDTGTGIAPDVVEQIFEPFFTTKEQGKGTGLGLAAVLGTVQQHNGSVTVESELCQGTTFVIRLPLVEQQATEKAEQDFGIRGEGVVLVVDDDEFLQRMATKTLEVLGYEVLTASDGLEAIEVYKREQGRIDVVLLDMSMPRMNGTDCFIELRRIDPNVCVVVASGYTSPEDQQAMRTLGMTTQLPKPYQRAELSRAVSLAIHQSKAVG